MSKLKLIVQFYIILLKSKMEYRFNFFLEMSINIFSYSATYLGIWIIMDRFNEINGWGYYEVMLLYNFNMVTYGFASFIFFNPMRSLDGLVKSGEFDSMLTRPINPFLHLILKQYYLGFFGLIALGTIVFVVCISNLSIVWTIGSIMYFIVMLIGGILLQASIIIFSGTLSLKFVQATAVMNTLIYSVRDFINYPLKIYDKWIQILLTFIIPYAFVNFIPLGYILEKETYVALPILKYGTIAIGAVMFSLSYLFFMSSINKYQSTGN